MKNRILKQHPLSERCIHIRNGYKAKTLYNIRHRSHTLQVLDQNNNDGFYLIPKDVKMIRDPYGYENMYRLDIFKNPHQLLIMPKPLSSIKWGYIKHAFKD